jgi:glycogen operon protein
MLSHGDELGRSQSGNNNVYCQDNEIAWIDWELNDEQKALLEFTRELVHLRREHPVFRRRRFFAGEAGHGGESELGDIAWLKPDASHMAEEDWQVGTARSVMVFLNGEAIREPDLRGERIVDDSFLLIFNAQREELRFTLPEPEYGEEWQVVVDTAGRLDPDAVLAAGSSLSAESRSVVLLRRPRPDTL